MTLAVASLILALVALVISAVTVAAALADRHRRARDVELSSTAAALEYLARMHDRGER